MREYGTAHLAAFIEKLDRHVNNYHIGVFAAVTRLGRVGWLQGLSFLHHEVVHSSFGIGLLDFGYSSNIQS